MSVFIFPKGFTVICQTVTLIYPARDPMMFYFCLGKMEKRFLGEKFKGNWSFNFVALISITLKLPLTARLWLHKRKERVGGSAEQRGSIQALIKEKLRRESLFR